MPTPVSSRENSGPVIPTSEVVNSLAEVAGLSDREREIIDTTIDVFKYAQALVLDSLFNKRGGTDENTSVPAPELPDSPYALYIAARLATRTIE